MKKLMFISIMMTSISLYSQNYLFDLNTNGFSLGGQLTSTNGSILIGVIPAYTVNGKLSFGLGIGYESNDDLDITSTSISPHVGYLVMKQGENDNPVSVGLNGHYQHNTFSDFDGLTGGTIGLGGSIHHEIKVSDVVQIIPGAVVGWNKVTIRQDGTNIGDDSSIIYGLLGTFKFQKLFLEPSLLFSDGDPVFNLTFGLLFPQ